MLRAGIRQIGWLSWRSDIPTAICAIEFWARQGHVPTSVCALLVQGISLLAVFRTTNYNFSTHRTVCTTVTCADGSRAKEQTSLAHLGSADCEGWQNSFLWYAVCILGMSSRLQFCSTAPTSACSNWEYKNWNLLDQATASCKKHPRRNPTTKFTAILK